VTEHRVPLPPFAEAYLTTAPGHHPERIVVLFHRWLGARHKSVSELITDDILGFLEKPSKRIIGTATCDSYRYELRKYLLWLEERGLAGPFERRALFGHQKRRRPIREEVREFLRYLAPIRQSSTVQQYRTTLRQFHEWLDSENIAVQQIDRAICLRWAQHLHNRGLHPATRVGQLTSVRKYLDWLWEKGTVSTPATLLIRTGDMPKKPDYLPRPLPPDTDRAIQERLQASDSDTALGLFVMRRTGLRLGELQRLERNCVRDDHNGRQFLKVPLGKLHNERLVPLDTATLEVISKLQQSGDPGSSWLFTGTRGQPRSSESFRAALNQAAAEVGEQRFTTHQLRHSFATSLMNGGMSLLGIMKLLGHRDYRMTLRYTAIADETVGREYFEALSRVAERYDLFAAEPELGPKPFDPLKALDGVIRWLESSLQNMDVGRSRATAHGAFLVARRLRMARDALETILPELVDG
jgi:site-specific recombinase XerD